jgi:CRP-like cAMP-binding protein
LNQIFFPSEINVDFREIARGIGVSVRIPAKGVVFREGEPSDNMYIVLGGLVEVTLKDKIIESVGPGDALGIVGLLDCKPRTVTATVAQDAELVVLDRKRFRFMVESVPHFVWYVIAELVGRLRATNAALGT